MSTPPSSRNTPSTSHDSDKVVGSSKWEIPSNGIVVVCEVGQGSFGTVYMVRVAGIEMAQKKMTINVASEREAKVVMLRREFRSLEKVCGTAECLPPNA